MKRFFDSLTFKIGISIVLVEIIILTVTGVYYTTQFSNQVDERIRTKVELPGKLINSRSLPGSLMRTREAMTELVGEEFKEGMWIRFDGLVQDSLNPDDRNKNITEIPGLNPQWFQTDKAQNIYEITPDGVVSVTPIHSSTNPDETSFFVYIKAGTAQAESEKRLIILNFVIGSIMAVFLTSIFIIVLFYFIISARVNKSLDVLRRVTSGDLGARVEGPIWRDQIGVLQNDINTMADQLQETIQNLERRVVERTADLSLSMQVGQQAATIKDLDELLPATVQFIWQQFHLYYVQIYLVDDIDQNLVWKAGAGNVNRDLDSNVIKSVPIDSTTLIGQAAVQRQAMMVANLRLELHLTRTWYSMLLEETDIHKHDPVLPDSRSELAIPLIVRGRVLGVLDIQHDEVGMFTDNNLPIYEAMAVQLAIAIDSARQWALAQTAQRQTEEALKQLTRTTWVERLASSKDEVGFMYDLSKVKPLVSATPSTDAENGLSLPLVIQEQTIGYLSVAPPTDRTWTDDELVLLQAVSQQLAQKVENLRLFEVTQQRATREQVARRIIDRVRASRNIEMALKIAAEELNKTLGTARAVIDLQIETQPLAEPAAELVEEATGINAAAVSTPANGQPGRNGR